MGIRGTEYEVRNGVRWLVKYEKDDNYLFRATKSLSINCEDLERAEMVEVHLPNDNILIASKLDIKSHNDIMTFNGEAKYYYPIKYWRDSNVKKELRQNNIEGFL